jgi:hypothetical protein
MSVYVSHIEFATVSAIAKPLLISISGIQFHTYSHGIILRYGYLNLMQEKAD